MGMIIQRILNHYYILNHSIFTNRVIFIRQQLDMLVLWGGMLGNKEKEARAHVAYICLLKWVYGIPRKDRIWIDYIRSNQCRKNGICTLHCRNLLHVIFFLIFQVALTEKWAEMYKNKGIGFYSMHPGWAETPGVAKSLPGFSKA